MVDKKKSINLEDYPTLFEDEDENLGLNLENYPSLLEDNTPLGKGKEPLVSPDFNQELQSRMMSDLPPQRGGSLKDLADTVSPVSLMDRAKVKNLVIDPEEQILALRKLGYNDAVIKNGEPFVGGVPLDSAKNTSARELLSELLENWNIPVETVAKTPLVGAVIGGGQAGIREVGKEAVFDIPANYGNVLVEGAFGSLGGEIARRFSQGKQITKLAKDKLTDKAGIVNAVKGAKNVVQEGSSMIPESVKKTTHQVLDNIIGEEAVAREYGAGASDLLRFRAKPITMNIAYLEANSPEFVEGVKNVVLPKNKIKNAVNLVEKIGGRIGAFYEKNADHVISGSDIIETPGYSALRESSLDTTIEPGIRDQILNERGKFLVHALQSDIPVKTQEMGTRQLKSKLLDQYGRKISEDIDINPTLKLLRKKEFNTKDIAELENALMGKNFKLGDLWDVRKNRDAYAAHGKQIVERAAQSIAAARNSADAIREAVVTNLEKSGLEGSQELLSDAKIFSELVPVVEMMDPAIANKLGIWASTKYIPTAIGTMTRKVAGTAGKIATSSESRALIRNLANMVSPEDVVEGGVKSSGSMLSSLGKLTVPTWLEGGRQMTIEPSGDSRFQTPLDITQEDIARIAPQEPRALPRDPELIASDPQALDELMMSLSPSASKLLGDAIQSKDPYKLRLATLSAMSEVPDMFEPSVTGNRSEIRVGDGFILADPMEAEVYKRSLRTRYAMGRVTRTFLSKQISALNDLNDMRLFPPAEGFPVPKKSTGEAEDSPLRRVRKQSIQTIAGSRNEHAY
jgi:hypothetical protein